MFTIMAKCRPILEFVDYSLVSKLKEHVLFIACQTCHGIRFNYRKRRFSSMHELMPIMEKVHHLRFVLCSRSTLKRNNKTSQCRTSFFFYKTSVSQY